LDDAAAGYANLSWFQVPFPEYNSAVGEVHPAVGDVDNDGRAEVVLGLGPFPGNGGWLFALDDLKSSLAPLGRFQVQRDAFIKSGGETFPAIGRLR